VTPTTTHLVGLLGPKRFGGRFVGRFQLHDLVLHPALGFAKLVQLRELIFQQPQSSPQTRFHLITDDKECKNSATEGKFVSTAVNDKVREERKGFERVK